MKRRAAIVTLGCRLNQADAALLADRLRRDGWTLCEADQALPGTLDLVVVNSCTVTAAAGRKSRSACRRYRKLHPGARIVATGCGVEAEPEAGWEGDLVVGNAGKRLLPGLLSGEKAAPEEEVPAGSFREDARAYFPFKSRAFIKIQEGCDNFCSYCIVPYARGRERSRDWAETIADCTQAAAAGFPELVLTGVNISGYRDGGRGLAELVDAVAALPGDFRIRLSSTEPHPANRELVEVMARHPRKVCRFLHLSLQHGSDRVLAEMGRRYSTADYAAFAAEARRALPGLHLGSDLIVGFPGETEADFEESCRFVEAMAFANLHIFPYSPRRGTPAAARRDQVPGPVTAERVARLNTIAEASAARFRAGQKGMPLPVIFEETLPSGEAAGWSDNYLKVVRSGAVLNRIVDVIY